MPSITTTQSPEVMRRIGTSLLEELVVAWDLVDVPSDDPALDEKFRKRVSEMEWIARGLVGGDVVDALKERTQRVLRDLVPQPYGIIVIDETEAEVSQ